MIRIKNCHKILTYPANMDKLKEFYRSMTNTSIRKKSFLIFLLSSFAFFLSLHPISFFVGGIMFLLWGWILPTVAVFSFALWVATFLVKKVWAVFLLSIPLAFILGLNTHLPRLFERNPSDNKPIFHINERVFFNDRIPGFHKYYFIDSISIPKRYYGPRYTVGGDEGCMCLYFERSEDEFDHLFHEGSSAPINRDGSRPKGWVGEIDKNRIEFRLEKQSEFFAKLTVDVYKDNKKTAWFQRSEILLKKEFIINEEMRSDLSWDMNFFVRALNIFMHDSVFTWDSTLPNPYDSVRDEVSNFLKEAISTDGPPLF